MVCPRCKKEKKIGQMEVVCQACQDDIARVARERNLELDNMAVHTWVITRKPQPKK